MNPACVNPVAFPALIDNRASLGRIAYRIGRYSDFRAAMLSALDRSALLRGWTHRGADDPGIALIEGAAILGDILTFYQELYANEAWLRTAAWPQSIAALARLIGYRPAPGLGGTGFVACELSGNSPVVVPAGFPFSAKIGANAPANFETSQSVLALPALSRFALYAPSAVAAIVANTAQVAASQAALAAAGITLKKNDRLMLVDSGNSANRQLAVVTQVATVLDQTVLGIAGGWQGAVTGTLTAYKLGRTFRAFGYNAPANQFTLDSDNTLQSSPVVTSLSVDAILQGFPLERQVNDLSAGITMLLDLQVSRHSFAWNRFESRTALSVKSDTDSVGPLQGGITRVAFAPAAAMSGLPWSGFEELTDRRTAVCHEVIGAAFAATGVRQTVDAPAGSLDFFGDGATYEALDGRLVQFVDLNPDDTAARVEEAHVAIVRANVGDAAAVAVRRLSVAPALTQFSRDDFPLSGAPIVVFGNVAPMTQGKTQASAVLGNGDSRQIFQSFQLPKAPLTWLLDEALTPPRAPQAQIFVNQIEWTQVDTLFASGPKDQVFILREDDSGNTWVQFGDGLTGATLPSGVNNVTAIYRTGNGANGWRQSGAKPQANARVANLSQLRLYEEVTGGSVDEAGSHIRETAPGRVEELGRIVSLRDFEFEALSLAGVAKARAVWDTAGNVPLLTLTVLMSDDTPAALSTVQAALSQANGDRGANRFPVLVLEASLDYVYVAATVGVAAGYQAAIVQAAVNVALGVLPDDGSAAPRGGLFSLDQRELGMPEYASRIEACMQNVDGVAWAEVTAFGSLGAAADPSSLSLPAPRAFAPAVACANDRVLALYAAQCLTSFGDA